MLVFWDCEFTGLHKDTTLISIGLVAQNGEQFYAELSDYDATQVNDWIAENVIANLWNGVDVPPNVTYIHGDKPQVVDALRQWFALLGDIHYRMVGDVLAYDWVLFCDLFDHAFNIPEGIDYIPVDLATALMWMGFNPDMAREAFIDIWQEGKKHNALYDATVIWLCWERLIMVKNGRS